MTFLTYQRDMATAVVDTLRVFPYNQNASSATVTRIRQHISVLFTNLDVDFYNLFARWSETSVERVVIPRETHNAAVEQLFKQHEKLREDAHSRHQTDLNAVYEMFNLIEIHRKMLVNAKRIRNTQHNQIRHQLRMLFNLSLKLTLAGVPNSLCDPIATQIKHLRSMLSHIKQNYTCTSHTLSEQIRCAFSHLRRRLCTLQANDETDIGRLVESAKNYADDAHLAMMMALREFAAEKEWNNHGWDKIAACVEKKGCGVVLTIRRVGSCSLVFQDQLDLSTSKISLETRNEFNAAQQDMIVHQDNALADSWWQTTPTVCAAAEEDAFHASLANLPPQSWCVLAHDAEQEQQEQNDEPEPEPATPRAAQEQEFDTDCATGFTPKASSSTKRSSFATTSSISKPKKSKKTKKFQPLQIHENTNQTTGALQNHEIPSKKNSNLCCKTAQDKKQKLESGNRSGKRDDYFVRWNKTRAHAKAMSKMCSSE
jgi:hypothetical protein